jgi:hypothetical protein
MPAPAATYAMILLGQRSLANEARVEPGTGRNFDSNTFIVTEHRDLSKSGHEILAVRPHDSLFKHDIAIRPPLPHTLHDGCRSHKGRVNHLNHKKAHARRDNLPKAISERS